jgi:DNA-directed RNA polymerase subunit RPC12/RpoP
MIGQRARCAACSQAFTIGTPTKPQSPLTSAAPKPKDAAPDVPEHVGFECHVCNTRLFARTADVGKKMRCPDCHAHTIIPPPPPPKKKNMPAAREGEQYELWDADEQPLPSQLIAAEAKTVTLKCRRCDTVMHPEVRLVGQPVRCPDCGATNIVPPPPRVVPKSVLASDTSIPKLDPAADPGDRPYVPMPVGKMLHEDEQEAEYHRALEKSRRTGKPMEIDHRGRAIMPRYPLITGIIPFLFSRGVLARWAGYSAASMIYDLLGCLIIWGFADPSASSQTLLAVIIVGLSAVGFILFFLWLAGLASIFFVIITESSEGNATIHSWPSANFTDWFPQLLYLITAAIFSLGPGAILARFGLDDPLFRTASVAIGFMLSFPIIVLSQLEIGSPFGLVSFRVVQSLIKCPFSWLVFYIETGILIAICALVAYFAEHTHILFTFLFTPLFVMSILLYGRLLGRLGWVLADRMGVETD